MRGVTRVLAGGAFCAWRGGEAGGGGGLRRGGAVSGEALPDGRAFCALLLTDELCRMNKL